MSALPIVNVQAQEVPRPSATRQRSVESPANAANLKVGEVYLTAEAALKVEYVDNVNLSSDAPVSDVIFHPTVGFAAQWQITELNTLRLRTTLGASKYLENQRYDQQNLTLAPDSALSFRIYAGDLRIEFHDRFSINNETKDEVGQSGLSSLPRFENTAGVEVLWELNDVVWSLGFDHYNFVTIGSAISEDGTETTDVSQLDHSTDQLSSAASLRLNDACLAGLEVAAAYSKYPNQPNADFSSFSVGPFLQMQVTRYTGIGAGFGVKAYSNAEESDGNPSLAGGSNPAAIETPRTQDGANLGFYANFGIVHRLNQYYSDHLDIGHEDQADAISGRTKINFVRYAAQWTLGRQVSLNGNVFAEDVRQDVAGSEQAETSYRRFGGALAVAYKLSANTDLSLGYQLTKQDSDAASASYQQNRVFFTVRHRF